MASCLRCGAGSSWIKGRVPVRPRDEEVEDLRSEAEELRAENAALRERVAVLERVMEAVCAVSWEHCNECRGPDGCVCGVLDLNAAVRAAKPAENGAGGA